MSQIEMSEMLAGACCWIRENLSSGRTRLQLADIYVKGQLQDGGQLTALRRAVEEFRGRELAEDDDEAGLEIADLLAQMSRDVTSISDLTLAEPTDYEVARR